MCFRHALTWNFISLVEDGFLKIANDVRNTGLRFWVGIEAPRSFEALNNRKCIVEERNATAWVHVFYHTTDWGFFYFPMCTCCKNDGKYRRQSVSSLYHRAMSHYGWAYFLSQITNNESYCTQCPMYPRCSLSPLWRCSRSPLISTVTWTWWKWQIVHGYMTTNLILLNCIKELVVSSGSSNSFVSLRDDCSRRQPCLL